MIREGRTLPCSHAVSWSRKAVKAAALLAEEGISLRSSMSILIKPIDAETVVASVKKTGCAVTC